MATKRESQDISRSALGLLLKDSTTEKEAIPNFLEVPPEPTIESTQLTAEYGRFLITPLEKEYGITLGNSLRRVLMSGLSGAAAVYVKIEGVLHEFSTIPGVLEDTTEIILNLKKVRFRAHTKDLKVMRIEVKGEREVTAGDITGSSEIEILNPDQHLASLVDKSARLSMEIGVATGKGYVPAERHRLEHSIGLIPVDSIFSPIYKVNYFVEDTRVGPSANYEKLHLELWSDKSLKPDEALAQAAQILNEHFTLIGSLGKSSGKGSGERKSEKSIYDITIDELDLSVRSYNCLKRANIQNVGELVKYSEQDIMNVRNFGKKSLDEIIEKLKSMGLLLRQEEEK